MPKEIQKLTNKFLSNPKQVEVAPPASTSKNVKQFLVKTHYKNKDQKILEIIQNEDVKNAFIFCNRKRDIAGLAKFLKNKGYSAGEMHGDMAQSARNKTLDAFKNGDISLLVCSDVAARGIDIDNVSHVFNYDVPMHPDDYVHRVGRTGRAGNEGRAWMIATSKDDELIEKIVKLTKIEFENADEKPSKSLSSKKSDSKSKQDKPKQNKMKKKTSAKQQKNKEDDVTGFGDEMPAFFKSG